MITHLKWIPTVVGAIALTLPSALPPVSAQSSPTAPTAVNLNLSPQQQTRLQTLQAALAAQLQSILTPQQWQQFQAIQGSGVPQATALRALPLTDTQKQQIKEVETNTNRQLEKILTRKQQQQLANQETSNPLAALVAQDKPAAPPIAPSRPVPPSSFSDLRTALKLSIEQEAQLQNIEAIIQGQIQAILTPSQWQQLQTLQTSNQVGNKLESTLQLSAAQVAQLKEVETLAQDQLLAILTRAQKEQLLTWQAAGSSALPSAATPASPAPATIPEGMATPSQSVADPFAELDLTPDQRSQVASIQSLLAGQLKTILTPDQWQTLEGLKAQGASQASALPQLKLSSQQQQQLKEAEALAQQRLLLLLTPEQQEALRQKLQS